LGCTRSRAEIGAGHGAHLPLRCTLIRGERKIIFAG
jgi:hypothetical protein